ncbi:SHOCT domain-containing protein [Amycolatopsis benzoatilytica]|uniref:SHOCT domain-containing protein n=1 Tax=Amycolatopsis benzoatilytica TaxID=346045 RepID=UPI00037323DB|nr:SHOCT domain-containing protein [Amycolatopsis benzoatilytica]
MPYWHYGDEAGWVGPVVMIVGAVLILAALGVVIALLVRRQAAAPGPGRGPAPGHGPGPGPDEAMTILRQRFARGEIDQEEYDRRREALRH